VDNKLQSSAYWVDLHAFCDFIFRRKCKKFFVFERKYPIFENLFPILVKSFSFLKYFHNCERYQRNKYAQLNVKLSKNVKSFSFSA